jgi:hypothetical protein
MRNSSYQLEVAMSSLKKSSDAILFVYIFCQSSTLNTQHSRFCVLKAESIREKHLPENRDKS